MILFGSGLQTWEYSPEFALRSYLFLLPYAALARLGATLSDITGLAAEVDKKILQFYFVRIAQAALCAIAELCLYDSCVFRFGKQSACMLLVFLTSSPGMFRAASELLPSSFAMIFFMFACSNWMVGCFNPSIAFVAIAACLGWPFAALLALPLALHVSLRKGVVSFLSVSFVCGGVLAAALLTVDSYFYGKVVLAPLNIVLYNIFPVPGAGPNLYGVEPWTFYFTNLFLNCNISFILFLFAPILWLFDLTCRAICQNPRQVGQWRMARLIFLSPSFLWMAVFLRQPHKEERFLVPIYPLIALVASVTISDLSLLLFGERADPRRKEQGKFRFPPMLQIVKTSFQGVLVLSTLVVGASRTYMQLQSFRAPFTAFQSLSRVELQGGRGPRNLHPRDDAASYINICMGDEWHRFPSHFFMPGQHFRLQFLRAGFQGLLPKAFDESGWGTRKVPLGMNMMNREDPNQYVRDPSAECHYVVDLDLSHRNDRHSHSAMPGKMLTLFSEDLLDLDSSPSGYRSFWLPGEAKNVLAYGKFRVQRNLDLLPISQ